MNKLKKKNLFVEINDKNFLVAVGEYDDELNFKIIEKEIFSPSGLNQGRIKNLEISSENLKKIIKKIENKSNYLFSEVNVIINQTDLDCINVSGFKKLNGNQVLFEDISYILNDVKSKIVEAEKNKSIIHLFNTKYLLDSKPIKNLPIGLYGDFYSHQLTFFMINDGELKSIKTLFNKCNLNINKIILKSFTEGIKIINKDKKDTFIKIKVNKVETQLSSFYESAFNQFQRFNFGSDMIYKDISKVCSLDILKVQNIISETNFDKLNENIYVDEKFFDDNDLRRISLKHIIEISSARIEELINIIFNYNNNLNYPKEKNLLIYLDFDDKNIASKFRDIFKKSFKKTELNFLNFSDDNLFISIEIFGELLSKGWAKEAIPIVNKKKSWISGIFSSLFE